MRIFVPLSFILITYSCMPSNMQYPETRKDIIVDTFYQVSVEDPYRWLEDDNSTETASWVKAQNEVTFDYLEKLPGRDKIKARLTELWSYPKAQAPFNVSGRWFMFKNEGLQNQYVLYTLETPESEALLLLDPNTLSEDGTVAFSGMDVTPDGKYLVYKIARSGSDWNEIFIMDIETREMLSDHIEWVKFSELACYNDGFFYSAYDKPTAGGSELSDANMGQKIFFHKIGDEQANDKLVYSNPLMPNRMYAAKVDAERETLFIIESESTSGNGLYVKSLKNPFAPIVKLAEGFDNDFIPIEMLNDKVLVLTNHGAPKYQLIAIDPSKPDIENWGIVIPENENTLQSVYLFGNKIYADYLANACSKVEVFNVNGTYESDLDLPGICSINHFNGTKTGTTLFYSYSSYNTPETVVKMNVQGEKTEVYFAPELKFDPDDYVVKQEFYKSKDGVEIPIFIIHHKNVELNGKNPAMLYGYGGFNISLTPSFSTTVMYYLENGGIYAVANLRGGGEFGEDWHKAGTLMRKQNVFNDFIAGAEYLIEKGYTNSNQLAIRGGSNGGLLIGAVTNQRPDLFKVALPAVGVMDMLRYQKFTIGYAWATDYGTVTDSEEMFHYLRNYSPVHNVEAKDYPAILVTTADHDDRVVPAHSFKYIARIQEMNTGKLPTLIRIDVDAGHGSGKPTTKIIEEYTDIYSFIFYHTKQ